jgi:hypothetical protein
LVCHRLGPDSPLQQLFPHSRGTVTQPRDSINRLNCQTGTISLVLDYEPKRIVYVALLSVPCDIDVVLALAHIHQTVDEPWVQVQVEDDRLVVREDGLEIDVTKPVGVRTV